MKRDDLYPSKYLKASKFNGQEIALTIDRVVLEKGKGDDGADESFPVVIFRPPATKGLRMNKTNYDSIAAAYGEETDAWPGKQVTLFPTTTNYKGETTACIRVRITPQQIEASMGQESAPPAGTVAPDI
jgi:hypothetical protein